MNNWQRAFEIEMQRAALFELGIGVIVLIVWCWITYAVIKAAIRDGIKESGMVETWARTVATTRDRNRDVIPDMRADR